MSVTNIVRAVVKPGSDYTVTSPIMKEDKGQILLIEGLDLPEVYEIDFSNERHHGTSVTMIGNADGVLIPTQFIKTGRDVFAFYYYVGDNFGQTEHTFRLPNSYRPDRTEEVPEPEQESLIEQAMSALNTAVVQTAQDARTATQKALEASESAQSASISEQNAADSAETAVNAKNAAEGYAEDAISAKNQAAASATSANESANTASVKASEASTSAITASVKADEARASAASASNDAGIASTAAGSASSDSNRAEQAKADATVMAQRAADSAQASADYSSSAQASATASAQSASDAETARQATTSLAAEAQGYADASEQSAANARTYALSANAASGTAENFSNVASQYASQAQVSANTASAKASEASTSASTASAKATESAQSATNAQGYAQAAEQAKTASQTAQGLAESARDDAIDAKNDAEDARDEAQALVDGISGKVEQIDQNTADIASLEEDRYKPYATDTASGSIASFSDGADDLPLKSLVVDINPVQDLHGQDAPYPAGGGKNKLPLTVDGIKALNPNTRGTWTGNSYTYLGITYTPVTDSDGNIIKIHVSGSGTKTGASYFDLAKINSIPYGTYILNGGASGINVRAYHFDGTHIASSNSAAGTQFTSTEDAGNNTFDIVVATDIEVNADVYPMVRLTSETDATFAPYENICPISGWTEVDVEQSGVNVWDEEWEVGNVDISTTTGELIPTYGSGNIFFRSKNYIEVFPNTSYWDYNGYVTGNYRFFFYDADKNYLSFVSHPKGTVLTTPANCKYMLFRCLSATGYEYENNISINYPSTDHYYHPYTGRSIPINLGQTVYGGKLDVLSGELVIDRAMVTFDGTETYLNNYFPTVVCTKRVDNNGDPSIWMEIVGNYCSAPTAGFANSTANTFQWRNADKIFGVSSADELKALFAQYYADSNPMTVVYPLAEPIEIQLSANQINSLYGVNNIWADSGDTEVEYRADTKLFIERLTAPDSADMIADSAITSGQFFMIGNSLYRALANIASGATITVGTNAQRVSLSDALNLVNA